MATELGSQMHSLTLAIRQCPNQNEAHRLLMLIIKRIRMRTGGLMPQTWTYPLAGSGGVGYTLVQPLLESLSGVVAIDAWPEVAEGGFYLIIHSCRPFSPLKIRAWLLLHGWQVISWHYGKVEINQIKRPWWKIWG